MPGGAVLFVAKDAIPIYPQQYMPLLQQVLQMEGYRQQRAGQGWEWGPSPARTAQTAHDYLPWAPQEPAPKSANDRQASSRDTDTPLQLIAKVCNTNA